MKQRLNTLIAGTVLAIACAGAALPAMAGDDMNPNLFVRMSDTDKDGMVSKDEMMKMVEKVWAKMDKSGGKMDAKQIEAFLKELMKGGG